MSSLLLKKVNQYGAVLNSRFDRSFLISDIHRGKFVCLCSRSGFVFISRHI